MRLNENHEDHNHSERCERIKVNKFRQVLYDEAESVLDKTLFEIFFDAKLRPEWISISHLVQYKKVESGMRGRRKRNFPKIPKSILEIDELMKTAPLGLNENYRGLLKDKGEFHFIVKVWSQYLQSYSFLRYASFHVSLGFLGKSLVTISAII